MEETQETGTGEFHSPEAGATRPGLLQRKYIITLVIFLIAVFLDQYSKALVSEHLYHGKKEIIPGFLDFKYAENPGMAFGMLQDLKDSWRIPLFSVITLVAVIIIFHLLRQAPAAARRLPAAMGLILSGAVGNLADRFQGNGSVVDFIRVRLWPPSNFHWPTFNLADTFISMGILLLLADMFFSHDEHYGQEGSAEEEVPEETDGSEEREERSSGLLPDAGD
jgi:signal peptidase II